MINDILMKSKGEKVNFINNLPYQQQILLTILYKNIK